MRKHQCPARLILFMVPLLLIHASSASAEISFDSSKVIAPRRPSSVIFKVSIHPAHPDNGASYQSVECQTLGFAGAQPYSGIMLHDGKWYALANKNDRMEDAAIFIGPFPTKELAAQESCNSFFQANLYLLRNSKIKKAAASDTKLNFTISPQPGTGWDSYSYSVDCDLSRQPKALQDMSHQTRPAEILSLNQEHYAFNVVKNTPEPGNFRKYDTFFDGPYQTKESAALRACQIHLATLRSKLSQSHQDDQKFSAVNVATTCPDLNMDELKTKFPHKVFISEGVDKESYMPSERDLLALADIAENYKQMTPDTRKKKYRLGHLLIYERMIADGDDPEEERQKIFKIKTQMLSGIKNGRVPLIQFVTNIKLWKFKFEPKTSQTPNSETLPGIDVFALDRDNVGMGTPHTKSEALFKLCQFIEGYIKTRVK